jgi:hypothetical protein
MFTTDSGRYADPYFELDDCDDESGIRLSRTLPRSGATIGYLYDFGDSWKHTITLEKIDQPETAPTHPVCVTAAVTHRPRTATPTAASQPAPHSTATTSTTASPASTKVQRSTDQTAGEGRAGRCCTLTSTGVHAIPGMLRSGA